MTKLGRDLIGSPRKRRRLRAARRNPPPIGCMSLPRWTKPRQASAPLHLSPPAGRGLRGGAAKRVRRAGVRGCRRSARTPTPLHPFAPPRREPPMSASRSSLPLGEAEWRGGVGVGGGWARREGDENDVAVGPDCHRHLRLIVDEAPRGRPPTPAWALPESALPRHSLRERRREEQAGRGGHAKRPCTNQRGSCVSR